MDQAIIFKIGRVHRLELQTKICEDFTITEKAPISGQGMGSWLACASMRFQPGEGRSRILLRDCENFAEGSLRALTSSV